MNLKDHEKLLDAVEAVVDDRQDAEVETYSRILDKEKSKNPASAQRTAESQILWLIDDFNSHGEATPVGRLLLKSLEIVVETAPLLLNNDKQRNATIRALCVAESVSEILGVQDKTIRTGIKKAKDIALHPSNVLALENDRTDAVPLKKLTA